MSAERGTRRTVFLDVLGCPPSGFESDLMFVDVRDCSLKVVGVPVNVPVKLYPTRRWEDLNPRLSVRGCSSLYSERSNSPLPVHGCSLLIAEMFRRCYMWQ